jgi:hypothetical protein
MTEEFDLELKRLFDLDTRIIELGKTMLQGNAYPMDYLAGTVLNRSLSLVHGYNTLARSENFLSAAHLIRPNLDTYLRFRAAWIVDDPHDFATRIMNGEHVRKMKDENGAKMTDAYLVACFKDDAPWIESTYEDTSGFIHLSRQHVISSLRSTPDGVMQGVISRNDHFIPESWKIEATKRMSLITMLICKFINSWIETKNSRDTNQE